MTTFRKRDTRIPRKPFLWLSAALLFTLPPMFGSLAIWVPALFLATLAAKFWMEPKDYRLRSPVWKLILGAATLVTDPVEKLTVMKGLIDHVAPGRWDHIRQPNEKELAATSVLSIPIVEASAKLRSGDPLDDEADYAMPIWSGQIPFTMNTLPPIADARLDASTPIPVHVTEYVLPANRGARVT